MNTMLTDEQLKAVTSNSNKILVRAGAGSGKTEVLTRRILYLLEKDHNLSISNIAVITFTNKATDNVKDRIKKQLYDAWNSAEDMNTKKRYRYELETLNLAQISTIHQFCRTILDHVGPSLVEEGIYYAPSFKVNEYITNQAIDLILEEWLSNRKFKTFDILTKMYPVHQLRSYFIEAYNLIKNKGLLFEEVMDLSRKAALITEVEGISEIKLDIIGFLKAVKQKEKELRIDSLSTDGLLEYAAKLLDKDEELVNRIQGKFKHIFVDEFQDTSLFQTKILKKLCNEGENPASLFVVGDVKQSIYQFRGADVGSYKSVEEWMSSEGEVLPLSTNFRSIEPLVTFFNSTFREIQDNANKPVFEAEDLKAHLCSNESIKEVVSFIRLDGLSEAERVLSLIQSEIKKGGSFKDYAILFRTNRNMNDFYEVLSGANIPVKLVGAGNLYECKEIKEMFRVLNWIVSPNDPVIREEALYGDYFKGNESNFVETEILMERVIHSYTVAQIIEKIMSICLIRSKYINENNFQALANLERLKEITRGLGSREQIQLVDYVKWLSIQIKMNKTEPQPEINDGISDAVQLITIHKAKGLEFRKVILVELDRNMQNYMLVPNFLYDDETGIEFELYNKSGKYNISTARYSSVKEVYQTQYLSEEARILYVAMTRAEQKLFFIINESVEPRRVCYQNWILNTEDTLTSEKVIETSVEESDDDFSANEGENVNALNHENYENKWSHQDEAKEAFLLHKRGILEMATGTGKTRTAINIIKELIRGKLVNSVIISLDGNDLLDQWYFEIIQQFRGSTVYRYYGRNKQIAQFTLNTDNSILIISRGNLHELFLYLNTSFYKKAILVCDEVHGIGSEKKIKKLDGYLSRFEYCLGLSATPEREYDEAGNVFIRREIGPVIYSFHIEDAIKRGILCEFEYIPLNFDLTEQDRMDRKKVIASYYAKKKERKVINLNELYTALANIKKNSEGKLPVFANFIKKNIGILNRCIIFVETIEFGLKVQEIIFDLVSSYHTYFGNDDQIFLRQFSRGEIDCLIAAKRLSEGIDIQSVENIILLTADRAKLQTIQRIGRSLRVNPSMPNKRATIVDFIENKHEDLTIEEQTELSTDEERKRWLENMSKTRREKVKDVK